ncbi:helix-turn-helix domain-containing protein [Pseudomonas piscis]
MAAVAARCGWPASTAHRLAAIARG